MSSFLRFPTVALVACLAAVFARSLSAEPSLDQARQALRVLPMRFEPNLSGRNPSVEFAAKASGYSVSLTAREAVLSLGGRELGISFVKSNPTPRIEGAGLSPARTNYFLGNRKENWHTGVPQYSRVRYGNVYPGVDVVYYGTRNQLEYDLALAPGADASRIRMKFRGADEISLTPEGDLRLSLEDRELVQKKPLIYQQDPASGLVSQVSGRYVLLGGNLVGVELGNYDRSRQLVIDPVLVYGSYVGDSNALTCAQFDKDGFIYVAGYTGTADLTGTNGAFQTYSDGNQDIFVAKLDPNASGVNSLLYLTYIGGTGSEAPNAMALDANGNVYLTGWTDSLDFPLAGNAWQTGISGGAGQDAFVLMLNAGNNGPYDLVYSSYFGGSGTDTGYGIAVSGAGVIYIVGTTQSLDMITTYDAVQNARWGPQDAFVAKFDPSQYPYPTLIYSTYFGGENDDEGRAIVLAGPDKIWIAGSTLSTYISATGNAYQPVYQGNVDGYLTCLDLTQVGSQQVVYSTYVGGSGYDEALGLAVDSAGRILVTGFTISTDFPTTPNAFQLNPKGNGEAFVMKLDPTKASYSSLIYSTYVGGSGGDVAYAIATDAANNVYLTGYTLSTDFPVTPDAIQPNAGGGINAFYLKLNISLPPGQALQTSSYIGQTALTVGNAIIVSRAGRVCLVGSTGEQNLVVTNNAFQGFNGGGASSAFIYVLGP